MCSIKSANHALYKNWTSESIISYIQNVSQNTVNMYYVNIKIKKKNTIGLARRIVIFLHCSFPVKVSGREGQGRSILWASILIVFCQCLLLLAICTNCRMEHYKYARKAILIYIWIKAQNRLAIALYILGSSTKLGLTH